MRRVTFLRQHTARLSGVVTRKCAGLRRNFARSLAGVSPVRRWMSNFFSNPMPGDRRAQVFPNVVGERAQRRDVNALHAVGERSLDRVFAREIEDTEKPASVLPLPVGEVRRIDSRL